MVVEVVVVELVVVEVVVVVPHEQVEQFHICGGAQEGEELRA